MAAFEYAACVPFGRTRDGVLFRAAAHEAPPDALVEQVEALLGLAGADVLRYADRRRGQRRSVRLAGAGDASRLEAFVLGGDTSAEAWIKALLQDEQPAQCYGRLLLAPGARAPQGLRPRGREVCSCHGVDAPAIDAALADCRDGNDDERLVQLQRRLRCGTNCGSCVPELRRMVQQHRLAA